jgi:hypothetical protein
VFAGITLTANSQFTILPQAGFENSNTKISYNDLPYFSPLTQLQPKFSLRADYKFKNGLAPFAGISTSRPSVSYSFTDPEKGMAEYNASMGNVQAQLQAGLQYTSKPIFFKKQTSTSKSSRPKVETTTTITVIIHRDAVIIILAAEQKNQARQKKQSHKIRDGLFVFSPQQALDLYHQT